MLLKSNLRDLAFCLAGILFSANGLAHPHSWINLNTDFILDSQGRLSALRQRWEFDIYYSMMTLADIMNEQGNLLSRSTVYSTKMVHNLRSYQYFSSLQRDGIEIELPLPKHYELRTKTVKNESVLELEMFFQLHTPLVIEGQRLHWRVFDPTYYIDIAHRDIDQVSIQTVNAIECSKRIELPGASEEMIDYAASLDKYQKDSQGLGENFAETVVIYCI